MQGLKIKVKLPSAHLEQPEAKEVYEKLGIPIGTLAERVRHVVQSAIDGHRIVTFSGGGFGSIIGRNSFQRPKEQALRFLQTIMKIYAGEVD